MMKPKWSSNKASYGFIKFLKWFSFASVMLLVQIPVRTHTRLDIHRSWLSYQSELLSTSKQVVFKVIVLFLKNAYYSWASIYLSVLKFAWPLCIVIATTEMQLSIWIQVHTRLCVLVAEHQTCSVRRSDGLDRDECPYNAVAATLFTN